MSSNIKVVCRIRPKINKETGNKEIKIMFQNKNEIRIQRAEDKREYKFGFDRIFYQKTSYAKPVIESVLQGFNGTVLAYGQTSSGKTFTMVGGDDHQSYGVIPRMIDTVFDAIEASDENIEYVIKVSVLEIYNEKIRDLLDVSKLNLKVRENIKNGFYIQDLTEIYVTNEQDIMLLLSMGIDNRSQASTEMNEGSSRSHMMFIMEIKQIDIDKSSKFGKLILVDLAGSESFEKAQTQGQQFQETKNINQSLLTLKNVIIAITSNNKFVPYRDSKLTKLCMDSLGGNSKTTLIITVSPSLYNESETINSLRFGEIARKIKNSPIVNIEQTVDQLKALLLKAEQELEVYKKKASYYEELLRNNRVNYEGQTDDVDLEKNEKENEKQNIEIDQDLIVRYRQQIYEFEEEIKEKNENIKFYNRKYIAMKNKCVNYMNELNLIQKQNKNMIERLAMSTIRIQNQDQKVEQHKKQVREAEEERDKLERESQDIKKKSDQLCENKYQLEMFLEELTKSLKEKERQKQWLAIQISDELLANEYQRQHDIANDSYVSLDSQYQDLKKKYEVIMSDEIQNYYDYKKQISEYIHNDYLQSLQQQQIRQREEKRKQILDVLMQRIIDLDKMQEDYKKYNQQVVRSAKENQKQEHEMQKLLNQLQVTQQKNQSIIIIQKGIEEKYIEKGKQVESLEKQLKDLQQLQQEQQQRTMMLENELKFIYNKDAQNDQTLNTPMKSRVSVNNNSGIKFYQSDVNNDFKYIGGDNNIRKNRIIGNLKGGRKSVLFSNNPSSHWTKSHTKQQRNSMIAEEMDNY